MYCRKCGRKLTSSLTLRDILLNVNDFKKDFDDVVWKDYNRDLADIIPDGNHQVLWDPNDAIREQYDSYYEEAEKAYNEVLRLIKVLKPKGNGDKNDPKRVNKLLKILEGLNGKINWVDWTDNIPHNDPMAKRWEQEDIDMFKADRRARHDRKHK